MKWIIDRCNTRTALKESLKSACVRAWGTFQRIDNALWHIVNVSQLHIMKTQRRNAAMRTGFSIRKAPSRRLNRSPKLIFDAQSLIFTDICLWRGLPSQKKRQLLEHFYNLLIHFSANSTASMRNPLVLWTAPLFKICFGSSIGTLTTQAKNGTVNTEKSLCRRSIIKKFWTNCP